MQYDIHQLEAELDCLDEIGGLECRYIQPTPIWIETFRRMDSLYKELCIARLNLLMTAQGSYPELVLRDREGKGDKMMQYSYINTSIIWYNNCFDLLLQVVWVFYIMWENNSKSKVSKIPLDWTLKQIECMKKECKYDKIEKWNSNNENKVDAIVTFHNSAVCTKVRGWANEIKHRAPLFVKGVGTRSPIRYTYFKSIEKRVNEKGKVSYEISFSPDRYDSHRAFQEFDIEELISTLTNYHKSLCECIKACTSCILKGYNSETIS